MMCEYDNDERIEFYDVRFPVALKDHKCGECGDIIAKGTEYTYYVGVQEFTGFWNFKECAACSKDREEMETIFEEDGEEMCRMLGHLGDEIMRALNLNLISETHPLVQKWFPEEES